MSLTWAINFFTESSERTEINQKNSVISASLRGKKGMYEIEQNPTGQI